MRRRCAALLLLLQLVNLPATFAQVPTLDCGTFETAQGGFNNPESVGSDAQQCRVNVCGAIYEKRTAYEGRLRNYSLALDEPFEELFLRLKTSLENYREELQAICGTEADPLPVCRSTVREGETVQLTKLGADAAGIRTECSADTEKLLDVADTVLHEILLQLAGDQRTHAYARRLDALAKEFNKINQALALVLTYINKIQLSSVVGTPQK